MKQRGTALKVWTQTAILAAATLVIWAAVAFGAPIVRWFIQPDPSFAGVPALLDPALGAPVLMIGIVFLFCRLQARIERRNGARDNG
ncbi:sodium/substrate symporter small subunit [Breoghania sp.]|uniref:sodium/substrate symporter small subunit n=1 Tax=Breoghania sp. TaxID=2065378 RepID=UPI002AA94A9A|nr:sodium/substrate symporter small subunit [Breoghania sp.]